MKVMVTGGAGFIGTNLIERLIKEGHTVVSLDNYDSGLEENHIDSVKYINADIETIEYIKGDDFDLCFHLAALSRIQPSFENPTDTFRVNVRGTEAVMAYGDIVGSCHFDDEPAYTTFTLLCNAHSITASVPLTFTLNVSVGFSNDG